MKINIKIVKLKTSSMVAISIPNPSLSKFDGVGEILFLLFFICRIPHFFYDIKPIKRFKLSNDSTI